MSHWNIILAWPVDKRLFPTKEEDDAAEALADFFHDNAADLPFRLPLLTEQERDAELNRFYFDLGAAKQVLDGKIVQRTHW